MADTPELEFVTARLREIRADLTKAETALGASVTAENVDGFVAGVTDALRRFGNEALATNTTLLPS